MKNKNVNHMECDCPYACKGENCKHMAAVLYGIDSGEIDEDDEL